MILLFHANGWLYCYVSNCDFCQNHDVQAFQGHQYGRCCLVSFEREVHIHPSDGIRERELDQSLNHRMKVYRVINILLYTFNMPHNICAFNVMSMRNNFRTSCSNILRNGTKRFV